MSSAKFTPGKWILETHHRYGAEGPIPVWYIKATNDVGIAVQPSFSCPDHETANAHLIAAAPELYAALDGLCGMAECWETVDERRNIQLENSDAYKAARSALKKARGE